VLFEEIDGAWLRLQREKRQTLSAAATNAAGKPGKKLGMRPMRIGTAYTGWTQAKDGRHNTADKAAYVSFGDISGFTSSYETLLRHCFDMGGAERRVANGGGEGWIKAVAEANGSILQLGPYHRSRAVTKAISTKSYRKLMFDAISGKGVDNALY